MGRLTKEKIDSIAKLRGEGFLQKEVAQKLGIHIRTVRKYDPTSKHVICKQSFEKETIESLKAIITYLLELLDYYLTTSLLFSDNELCLCPFCGHESLGYDPDKGAISCRACNYTIPTPDSICHNCFKVGRIYFDISTKRGLCQECLDKQSR